MRLREALWFYTVNIDPVARGEIREKRRNAGAMTCNSTENRELNV